MGHAGGIKKTAILLLCVVITFCLSCCGAHSADSLHYDGVYCYVYEEADGSFANMMLCFCDDGTVFAISVLQADAKDVRITRESSSTRNWPSTGNFEVTGHDIVFSTTSESGTVDYWGTVQNNKLVLNSHSNINGNDSMAIEYVFYPFGFGV